MDWLQTYAGIAVPLERFVFVPEDQTSFGIPSIIEMLAEDLVKGEARIVRWLDFARGMYFDKLADSFWSRKESIQMIDRVLSEHPDHVSALVLKAHLLCHPDKHDRTQNIIEELFSQDGDHVEAWEDLSDIFEKNEMWTELEYCATQALDLTNPGDSVRTGFFRKRICAGLELGNYYGAMGDLFELEINEGENGRSHAAWYREWYLKAIA
ncbi:tetratricopeptide repeat protein [Thermodesulfobacteriota bacterium]